MIDYLLPRPPHRMRLSFEILQCHRRIILEAGAVAFWTRTRIARTHRRHVLHSTTSAAMEPRHWTDKCHCLYSILLFHPAMHGAKRHPWQSMPGRSIASADSSQQ